MTLPSFIFGGGNTETPTYESLKRKRAIADLLTQQAVSTAPKSVGEGIASIGQALLARVMEGKLGPQEDAERSRISELLGGIGGGPTGPVAGAPGGFTGAGYSGDPSTLPAPQGGYGDAIASIESGGNYGATGPVTGSGDRAYGKYQVMGNNIPEWSQAALGRQLTPEAFLADPKAQDAIFNHRFGGYVDQYGPEGAASMWFSGDPTPDGSSDQLGTSDTSYVQKFMDALGGGGATLAGGPDMGRVGQLAEIISNPYATEGQKLIAKVMIEKAMEGGEALSPYEAGQLGLGAQDNALAAQEFEYKKAQDAKPKTTDDTTEYDRYVGQATAAGEKPISFRDWQLQMRKAGAANVAVDTGADPASDAKFYSTLDEGEGVRYKAIIEGAPLVFRTGQQLGILEQQLAQAPQGAQGAWTQVAGNLGLPIEGVDDVQAAQATINALVPQQRPPGSGTMSDADLALFKGSLPKIINQPGGNALIMETLKAINAYDQQLVQITEQLASRAITREEARKQMRSIPNPIDVYRQKSAELGKGGSAPVDDADLFKKYGLD